LLLVLLSAYLSLKWGDLFKFVDQVLQKSK